MKNRFLSGMSMILLFTICFASIGFTHQAMADNKGPTIVQHDIAFEQATIVNDLTVMQYQSVFRQSVDIGIFTMDNETISAKSVTIETTDHVPIPNPCRKDWCWSDIY
jgi:hypothetical protein